MGALNRPWRETQGARGAFRGQKQDAAGASPQRAWYTLRKAQWLRAAPLTPADTSTHTPWQGGALGLGSPLPAPGSRDWIGALRLSGQPVPLPAARVPALGSGRNTAAPLTAATEMQADRARAWTSCDFRKLL